MGPGHMKTRFTAFFFQLMPDYKTSTEQFNYIPAQIEHLIYKPNTNWQHSISTEDKLAISIRYLYLLSFKSIKHVHPTAPIITNLEKVLCRDGYY